jgi:hypothetical protein
MSRITWENVRPLLDSWYVADPDLHCRFRCPATGRLIDSSAPYTLHHAGPRITPLGAKCLRRTFWNGMQRGVLDLAGSSAVGHAVPGRIPSAPVAARPAATLPVEPPRPAVLQAFRGVVSRLWWDGATGRWMSPATGVVPRSGFLEQRLRHPVSTRQDLLLLGDLVTEVTRTGGVLSPDESGELASGRRLPPLHGRGLEAASPGPVRETMLMIAWAAALCDESLDTVGRARLEVRAADLAIMPSRAGELEHLAAIHVLEMSLKQLEALLEDDRQVREEAGDLARRLGLERSEIDRILFLYFDGPSSHHREEPCRDA